jgi:hypothetical protein
LFALIARDERWERQYLGTQEFNACTAIHSAFERFQPVDLSNKLAALKPGDL